MNVTLTHPVPSFTGNVNLENGAAVLGFTGGTCSVDLAPGLFEVVLSAGITITVGTPGPVPPYDANTDTLVAAIVAAATSATTAQLKQAYAAGVLPAHARSLGLLNRFDPARSAYNWKASNTRRLRASISAAAAGKSFAHHVFVGDSETENYMGPVDGFHSTKMWPVVYRDLLATLTGAAVAGDGYIKFPTGSGSSVDERVTLSSGWTVGVSYISSTTNGNTITVATTKPCTNVDLYYEDTTGSFSISVDGGAATTVAAAGSNGTKKKAITGLANTTHSIVITNTATTGTGSYPISVNCYSGTAGLLIHNLASYGSNAYDWVAQTSTFGWMWNYLQVFGNGTTSTAGLLTGGYPAVVFCQLGVNDVINGRTPAQITADLTTIRNQWPNSDFVLLIPQSPTNQSGFAAAAGAIYQLADTLDVPLIDNFDRAGSPATATANGALSSDGIHSPLQWQREEGRVLAGLAAA